MGVRFSGDWSGAWGVGDERVAAFSGGVATGGRAALAGIERVAETARFFVLYAGRGAFVRGSPSCFGHIPSLACHNPADMGQVSVMFRQK